jgi:hypothetical protein
LETYVENFTTNVAEELADLLDWRSSAHELLGLLTSLGVDASGAHERLAKVDSELRKHEWWFKQEGVARDRFWLENAPPDYWWCRLGLDGSNTE